MCAWGGVMTDESIEIFIGNGKIVWLLELRVKAKSGMNCSVLDIACFNETSLKVY